MNVRIDQTRHHPPAIYVDGRHAFGRAKPTGHVDGLDGAIDHQHIGETIEVIDRIDDASAVKQKRLQCGASASFIESTIE